MKIIGPIAGIGSRLRPFTLNKPKAFINVAGKTVLDHILSKFINTFDSDTELILIVGYKKKRIIDYVKKKYSDKFKLTFVEQIPRGYSQDNVSYYWGLGEAVYLAHRQFKDQIINSKVEDKREGSLIFLGDMLLLDDYSYIMYRYYESEVNGIITVMRVPKKDASSYGIVVLDENGLIKKLVEKPKEYISNLAIAGIYAFSNTAMQALFKHLKKYLDQRTEDSKEIYLTESMQDLVDEGFKIAAIELKKGILDFGRPSEVLNSNQFLLEYRSVKKEDYQSLKILIERSFIKNPNFIGKYTKIINSIIGPYVSLGNNCVVKNSILENSVIENNTILNNIISKNSIIGSYVNVENISKDNLIIGDKSVF
ncbi:MAG: sugar phosphate nucleotidyltransferase [Promethearchaeota archaeon]